MSFFVQSTPAPLPKTQNVRLVSLGLGAILVAMVVAQLFTFEAFPSVIASFNLPGGEVFAHVLAALFVTLEVLALPFLLAMRLSPAMRIVSMVAGWFVVTGWLLVSLWHNVTVPTAANSGFLGVTTVLPSGWWSVFFCLALSVLVVWTSWGMWPLTAKTNK